MTSDISTFRLASAPRPRRSAQRMRIGGLALACAGLFLPMAGPRAEEPLYVRIRAQPAARLDGPAGSATAPNVDAGLRETVWERSDRRARIAIASVCTGCLAAPPSPRAFMSASVAEAPASDPPFTLSFDKR